MKVWYNDNDKKCCSWLKELMSDGMIPQGDIDNRSICDVHPYELRGYDQCHFFCGIG
jgi:DNA (cytosine-5)-methyltransferase 1